MNIEEVRLSAGLLGDATNEILKMRHRVREVTNVHPNLTELGNSQPLVMYQTREAACDTHTHGDQKTAVVNVSHLLQFCSGGGSPTC